MWITFSYIWLPYMIVPLYGALERIPTSLLDASNDLGGSSWLTFRRVMVPLALPGLIAGSIARDANLSAHSTGALLIGVDLGPNLSVTGSLATLLWLVALRREGEDIGAGKFLALGALVMPPALLASLACFAWVVPG